MKGQQGNTSQHSLFSCHILAAAQVYLRELAEVKHMGCLGGSAAQLWKGLHLSPSMGVAEAQVR